jgi:hypothetical protein
MVKIWASDSNSDLNAISRSVISRLDVGEKCARVCVYIYGGERGLCMYEIRQSAGCVVCCVVLPSSSATWDVVTRQETLN